MKFKLAMVNGNLKWTHLVQQEMRIMAMMMMMDMIIGGNRWEFKVEYLVQEEMPPSVH